TCAQRPLRGAARSRRERRRGAVGPGVIFLFSSRRRHTRCYRDWSSDVCSSDLAEREHAAAQLGIASAAGSCRGEALQQPCTCQRSEERRVGKECRYGGGTDRWVMNRANESTKGTERPWWDATRSS